MSNYNPIPPRVWSRVQNQCTFTNPGATYDQIYIPLTGQVVSQAQADYEKKQIYKGNILQYKGNSARLTKAQKYSQLAKMNGPNRTKVFATQSQTYSNPNTTGLLRVGYSTYQFPNQIDKWLLIQTPHIILLTTFMLQLTYLNCYRDVSS